jgi:drug efflux transport system ATP-binding protein
MNPPAESGPSGNKNGQKFGAATNGYADGQPRAPVISFDRVIKRFALPDQIVTALDELTLEVPAGRLTGLVGPDGAGKTTMLRLICGLLDADSGTISVLGSDPIKDQASVQANIGYMPQRFGLYEDLSVLENLNLYADLHGLSGPARNARFNELMHFTGLGEFRSRLAGRLSGGMKQKLGLACTLVHPPKLLLLDQPSAGVDPLSRRELWHMVETLVDEGITVLWATSYLDEAARCHQVLLLSEGHLLEAGPPSRIADVAVGRTFTVTVPTALRATLTERLQATSVITDAIIKGRDIRILMNDDVEAETREANLRDAIEKAGVSQFDLRPAPPSFEDSFISLLAKEQESKIKQASGVAKINVQNAEDLSIKPSSSATPLSANEQDVTRQDIGSAPVVVEVDNLVRTFGDFTAVDRISFSVRRGEIFGLLGPNGAGKSTTFKMLCGLLPPTDGKALVLGIDLRRAAATARARIGYMAQKFSLYGNLSVAQNLNFYASAYGLRGRSHETKINWAISEFQLHEFARADADSLPLGFKQRLALACALMHGPGILFLDEPTSGVDPIVRREFWKRINAIAKTGVTVMVTTHFMEEAEYCDRIGIVYRGQLIAVGTPDDLKEENVPDTSKDDSDEKTPSVPTLEDAFINLIERHDREQNQ